MKKIIIILCTLLLILVALPFIVIRFVDINDYKSHIVSFINEKTGKHLDVGGDMKLSVYPNIAIVLPQITLSETKAQKNLLFQAESLILDLKLMPLLSSNVEISELTLDTPHIFYRVGRNNKANWDFSSSTKKSAKKTDDTAAETPKEFKFNLDNFTIKNGHIAYKNSRKNTETTFEKLNAKAKLHHDSKTALTKGTITASSHIHYQGDKTLPVDLTTAISISDKNYQLSSLKITIDGTAAEGDMTISLAAKKPTITANLASQKIDLNKILNNASSASATKKTDKKVPTGRWSKEPIRLSFLNGFQADMNLKIAEFISDALLLRNLDLTMNVRGGKLQTKINSLSLFEGTISGNVTLNASAPIPQMTSNLTIDNIDLERASKTFPALQKISGRFSSKSNLKASIASQHNLIQTLSGTSDFAINQGHIKGIDLISLVKNIIPITAKEKQQNTKSGTSFNSAKGDFVLRNGIITNDNFLFDAPKLKLAGKGDINLPSYTVNYRLTPKFSDISLTSLVPVLVKGKINSPLFLPDLQGTIGNIPLSKQGIQDLTKDVEKLTKGSVKGILGVVTGNGTTKEEAPATETTSSESEKAPANDPKKAVEDLKNIFKGF